MQGSWYKSNDCNNNDTITDNSQNKILSTSRKKLILSEDETPFSSQPEGLSHNSIINMKLLEDAINQFTCCKDCHQPITLTENVSKRQGWGQAFVLSCSNVNCSAEAVDLGIMKNDYL